MVIGICLSQNEKTNCITFKPGDYCRIVEGNLGYLRQWKVNGGDIVGPQPVNPKSIYALAASMDGRWIVSGDLDSEVIVWNAVSLGVVRKISEHTGHVYAVDVSSDSTRIASGSLDRTVRIFDIISGARVIPPLQHDNDVIGVKFSPDNGRISTATFRNVGIYNVHTGNKLFSISVQLTCTPITPLAWSFDGRQLFVGSPAKVICVDTSTFSHSKWNIQNDNNITSIVTHRRFIACSAGSSVSFWDYTSRQQIGITVRHARRINCISISHDGSYLACGHHDGIVVHSLSEILPEEYLHSLSRFPLVQLSDEVLKSWKLGNSTNTESILSREIAQVSAHNHHMLAARSLIRTRSREWKSAIEDAEMSLQIEQSPIGHIARSLALIGAGKQEVALDDFDFVFCHCHPSDIMLLLVIKSIILFTCGKHKQAISHLQHFITANEKTKDHYTQVLGNMYLKLGDYENAAQTLLLAKNLSNSEDSLLLIMISFIFNWNFDRLEVVAWQRLCEFLHTSGRVKEVGETLLKMVNPLAEDEKERAHGRVLEEIVMRSGRVALLLWTGKSSRCNSCLPSSPAVYDQQPFALPRLEPAELENRTDELRAIFPLIDALVFYDRVTRFQPVRFAHFRLHLPCIIFGVRRLRKEQEDVYYAETAGLGDVEFTTVDTLPLKEPRRLVFADLRIHDLLHVGPAGSAASEDTLESDAESNSSDIGNSVLDTDAELLHAPIIEEAPSSAPQLDTYTRALQLIAHLGQPFSALLLLRQSDGAYKRVAADHKIIVRGTGKKIPKDIRVEVLEIV